MFFKCYLVPYKEVSTFHLNTVALIINISHKVLYKIVVWSQAIQQHTKQKENIINEENTKDI